MIERNENGKLWISTLDLAIIFEDLFELAENRKEVEFILNTITGESIDVAQNKLEELGDENPYDIEINL